MMHVQKSQVRDRNQTTSSATFSGGPAQRASPQEACEGLSRHKRADTVQASGFNLPACEMTGRSDVNVTKLS